jgi:hypothetical protein
LIGLVLAACASTASAAPPAVTLGFTWSPHDPIVGQQVRFISTSTATSNNSIQQELWDLNGDGQFGDQAGRSAVTTFSTAGNQIVRLRVIDKHGADHNHVHSETVAVRPFDNQPPVASFVHIPDVPLLGQQVDFYSTATDADSAIAIQSWDLDGDGNYGDASGPTASRTFRIPGSYVIGLQVQDINGAVSFVSTTLSVGEGSVGATLGGGLRELFPFPVVRLSGTIRDSGIRVRRLTVDAPSGARTEVRCIGRRCPFALRRHTHKTAVAADVWRLRRLDRRFLRAGVRLQVFVSRPRTIGRYTRFKIRSGRPPLRVDRCLVSVSKKPVSCPAG